MRIGQICRRSVVTCGRDTSAYELAQLMRDRHVGDVIVVEPAGDGARPIGIVTDRDLVVRVMAAGVDPGLLRAGDMIVGDLVTAEECEFVYEAVWHMRSQGVRRLPIVDGRSGQLVGIVTADDVTLFLAAELTDVARTVPSQVERERARSEPASH